MMAMMTNKTTMMMKKMEITMEKSNNRNTEIEEIQMLLFYLEKYMFCEASEKFTYSWHSMSLEFWIGKLSAKI